MIYQTFCLFVYLGLSRITGVELIDLEASIPADFQEIIGDRDVIFYAIDVEADRHFAYKPDRAAERHAPWSSFKIPNLVIALETGVARALSDEREWDANRRPAERYWPSNWKQGQTLETAFRRSAVWYFKEIAVEVGGARYRTILKEFQYGNAEAPDDHDSFWLHGPLMISPQEQSFFLARLLRGEFTLKSGTIQALRKVSLINKFGNYEVHGKTGSGPVKMTDLDGAFEGWLVGWVENAARATIVFAFHVRGPNYSSIKDFRYEMSVHFLRELGALPEE